MRTSSFLLFVCVIFFGCSPAIKDLPISNGVAPLPCCGDEYQQTLQIKYLGVGGFVLQRGHDVILTAPFFSNPSLLRVGLSILGLLPIQADPQRIDAFLPPMEEVAGILVGHAHYDHLMDIPYIAQKRTPRARVYGSETMKNILSAVLPEERLIALDAEAADPNGAPGRWQTVIKDRIRIMAVRSKHAPHRCLFDSHFCLKLFQGMVEEPLHKLPRTARGWKEGQTFAYLIDFLDEQGAIAFRIHYQDAASSPPRGFPPHLSPQEQKRVDVAILCVPGYREVRKYPERLIRAIQPRFVVLAHWENFFRPRTGDPGDLQVVPGGTDPKEFITRLKTVLPNDAAWILPRPGAWLHFTPLKP